MKGRKFQRRGRTYAKVQRKKGRQRKREKERGRDVSSELCLFPFYIHQTFISALAYSNNSIMERVIIRI